MTTNTLLKAWAVVIGRSVDLLESSGRDPEQGAACAAVLAREIREAAEQWGDEAVGDAMREILAQSGVRI